MNRRRLVALVAVLVVAGTMVFPSGAAPLFSGPADNVGGDVELAPSSDYAYLQDGELVVDLSAANPNLDGEGVNGDAVTRIEDVFAVRYNGSRYAHVWLTHESEDVTFRVDGEPIQSEANNVTLAPNQSVSVSLAVNMSGETTDALLDEVTVHATVADPESVDATSGSDTQVEFDGASVQERAPTESRRSFTVFGGAPDSVYDFDANALELDRAGEGVLTLERVVVKSAEGSLSMDVTAVRGESSRSLVREAGAEPLGAARVTVESGSVHNATLRYSVSQAYLDARGVSVDDLAVYRDDDGDLSRVDVTVTGERDGRVYFEAAAPGFSTFVVAADRARLQVTEASLNRTAVEPGAAVTVSARVTNDGSIAGERTIPVTVDGEVVAERTVSVDAGETATLTVQLARNATGEYDVAVDGVGAGAFSVERVTDSGDDSTTEPSSDQSDSVDEPPSDGPTEEASGFSFENLLGLVALLGIAAATLFLARRAPWQ